MTEDQFIDGLIDRHASADIDGASLKDIRNLVAPLKDAQRKDLFDWYVSDWRSAACPRAGYFAERLRSKGAKVHQDQECLVRAAWICAKCKTRYSLPSQGCPRCGSGATDGLCDAAHPAVVECKPDCWQCTIYHDDEGHKYGPECEQWGKERYLPQCRDCRCKQCCAYESLYRRNPAAAIEKPMPWIKGSTTKEIIND